jgi:uncharacterized protein YkwD
MKQNLLWLIYFLLSIKCLAQSVPAETGSRISHADAQAALDFHNKARKDVGTNPLTWSAEVAAYAQAWADSLASRNCAFEHRANATRIKNYGENIFWGSSSSYTAVDASESWYSEIEKYVHGPLSSQNWSVAGHYTQMVWATSTMVGIGSATCAGGEVLVVANYNPPGNYMGEKAY